MSGTVAPKESCLIAWRMELLTLACADIEWKVVYVGSASDKTKDQVLDLSIVGPLPFGASTFELDVRSIETGEMLCVAPAHGFCDR